MTPIHAVLTSMDGLAVILVADVEGDEPFLTIEIERDAAKNVVAIDLKSAPSLSERALLLRNPDKPSDPAPGALLPPGALLSLDLRAPKRARKKPR